jgi:hypothetical protein
VILRIPALVGLVLGFFTATASATERPIVVELFTSQGCSSCPPANAFLNEMSKGRSDVLPLAFHVTYWDRLGWKDPFSFEAATNRQDRYGHRFGDGSYTPEMVVDGSVGLVGSDRDQVNAAIARAKQAQQASPDVNVGKDGDKVAIKIGAAKGSGKILLIGFDHEHVTQIGRGENGGRTLPESNVRSANGPESPSSSMSVFRTARMSPSCSNPRTAESWEPGGFRQVRPNKSLRNRRSRWFSRAGVLLWQQLPGP